MPLEAVPDFLAKPGSRAVLMTRAAWEKLGLDESGLKIFEARGINAARPVTIHIGVKLEQIDLVLVMNAKPSALAVR